METSVEVRLNTPAVPELIAQTNPDVLIIATGARPVAGEERGIEGSGALQATDIFMSEDIPGETSIVVGGGYVGCEAALYLTQRGQRVTIVEQMDSIGQDVDILTMANFRELFEEYSIKIVTHSRVEELVSGGLIVSKNGKRERLEADNIILALGFEPDTQAKEQFNGLAKRWQVIGDAHVIGRLMGAIHSGFAAGFHL